MTLNLAQLRTALADAESTLGREAVLERMLPALDSIRPTKRTERHTSRAPIDQMEWRDPSQTGNNAYVFNGHASTVDSAYTLMDMGWLVVTESVARTAFDQVLSSKPDVHLNLNHNMERVMARTGLTGVGSLELSVDHVGLRTYAQLDPDDPDVQALAIKMKRGLIDQMSFAFSIENESRTSAEKDGVTTVHYSIDEIADLYDVCACAQGANPMTDSSLRALCSAVEETVSRAPEGANGATQRQPADEARGGVDVGDAQASGVLGQQRKRERALALTLHPLRQT